jgi:PAS domain S-box-containing protein
MHLFHNLPIRRKLTAITTLASGIALCVACLAFMLLDQLTLRQNTLRNLRITAAITGANCAAGMTFNEPSSVEQTLKSLSLQPGILRCCVYDKEGRPFAVYQHPSQSGKFRPPPVQPDGHYFESGQIKLFQAIKISGEEIGTVYLVMDSRELTARIWHYTLTAILVLLAAILVALFLSARLQKVISEPLVELAQVVARVGTERDYSIRVAPRGADEVGRLIEGFNGMLGQIQARDEALESARTNLEQRVDERTKELAGSLSLLNATLESTTDGILAVDLAGKITCYNQTLLTIANVPPDLMQQRSYVALANYVAPLASSPEQYLQWTQAQTANPENEFFSMMLLKDGRVFERYVRPQKIGKELAGQVIILRDVTERRLAEHKLEEVSRRAGMAEIATNVLHNVGNVLNSVNTSAAVIQNKLQTCRSSDLREVTDLLAQNQARLGEFLLTDDRGAQLVGFLRQLDHHIVSSQADLSAELDGLVRNVEHIKEIVAMQQDYARTAGKVEPESISWLVEDALRIYNSALGRHQVRLVRNFEEIPNIPVNRHKVLEILVNLLSNAKRAMAAPEITERTLTLGLRRNGNNRVQVLVQDTGVGIPAENLTRIFHHGFTTYREGHGFGLHSAALAAKEMSGSLMVHSDGPGRGATFTLELPITLPTET